MYRPVKTSGDTVPVPRLLFSKLEAPGDDARFRVALYLLQSDGANARQVARALSLPVDKVEAALSYWEGAGLIEQEATAPPPVQVPAPRKRMTTREVVRAGQADATLGMLLGELQRLFGMVMGEGDANLFVTLYVQDGFPADLILMAASQASQRGIVSARYVEKMLFGWRREGIDDCAKADAALKLLARREAREAELAARWGLVTQGFTLAEKKKIAQWYEEYGFETEMIEAARLAAGEHAGEIKYLAAILKKWYAKGYHTPREVTVAEGGQNLRVSRGAAAKTDVLGGVSGYVPMKKRTTR